MQKVTLIGNLGSDPTEKFTTSGKKVVSFSLAVTVKKDIVNWFEISIWEERIPIFAGMLPYLKKGSKICIIGDLGCPQPYMNKKNEPSVRLHVQPISINFVGGATPQKKEEVPISVFTKPTPPSPSPSASKETPLEIPF